MKPSEKIIELRGEVSRPKFGAKYGVPAHTIKYIEEETQNIPDDLALKLEKEHGIPFKWWKTGQGPDSFEKLEKAGVNIDYLITGEGEPLVDKKGIPYYDDPEKFKEEVLKEAIEQARKTAREIINRNK
jgi:plasmid maintenance system antidote protein VapI